MTYLARYEAGEHEGVWQELRALGPAVHDDSIAEDAKAVADATMRRVKANLQRIETGLHALGYRFMDTTTSSDSLFGSVVSNVMASAMEALKGFNGITATQKEQMLAATEQQLRQLAADERASAPSPSFPAFDASKTQKPGERSALGDPKKFKADLNRYEKAAGPAPLSVASFWRTIGWVDFDGQLRGLKRGRSWEPMAVMSAFGIADDFREHRYDNGSGEGFTVQLVPGPASNDPLMEVHMPAAADVQLPTGEWFVDYLRRTTKAAGHAGPGSLPPQLADIAAAWEPF